MKHLRLDKAICAQCRGDNHKAKHFKTQISSFDSLTPNNIYRNRMTNASVQHYQHCFHKYLTHFPYSLRKDVSVPEDLQQQHNPVQRKLEVGKGRDRRKDRPPPPLAFSFISSSRSSSSLHSTFLSPQHPPLLLLYTSPSSVIYDKLLTIYIQREREKERERDRERDRQTDRYRQRRGQTSQQVGKQTDIQSLDFILLRDRQTDGQRDHLCSVLTALSPNHTTKKQNTYLYTLVSVQEPVSVMSAYALVLFFFAVILDDRAESHKTRLHLSENRRGLTR